MKWEANYGLESCWWPATLSPLRRHCGMLSSITQMRFGRGTIAVVIALAVSGGASSCGGSEGEESVSTLTKAQWLERDHGICGKGNEEVGRPDFGAWKPSPPAARNAAEAILNKGALALLPVREEELRLIR